MFRRVYGFFRSLFLPFFVSPSFLALPAFFRSSFFRSFHLSRFALSPFFLFFVSFPVLPFSLFSAFLFLLSVLFFSALPTFPALLFAYIRLFCRCSKNGRKMPDKGQRHFLWICVPFAHIMRTPKILCFFVPKYWRPLFYGEKRLKTEKCPENQPAERFRYYGGRRCSDP